MPEKKPYEAAVEIFDAADAHYRELEEKFLNGDSLLELLATVQPGNVEAIKAGFQQLVDELKDALEERNVQRKTAAEELRKAVVLTPGKWRGPEGKPQTLTQARFAVSSVTGRSFDQKSLFDLVQKKGLLERLLDVRTIDKKTGREKKIVEQTYEIDYDGVYHWLKSNGLKEVIDGAYDEEEGTPQVKGPKELYFLGEEKKS